MSSTLNWGTPSPATPPATLDPADGLQPLVDAIAASASGGAISLENGTYYADPANPATPLTIPAAAYDMLISGTSAQGVVIGSPILVQAGKLRLADMHIDPPAGSAYGIKIYNGGSPFLSRCVFDRIIVGDRTQFYTNGPTNGLQIDGAGIMQCNNCTFAFCAGNGLLVDSTGVEPNTTLQFDMCSFVGNGQHGIKLSGSCSIAEFRGGNSEQNGRAGTVGVPSDWCELYAENMNNLIFTGFDFESTNSGGTILKNAVNIQSCRPVRFDGCNFLTPSANVSDRAILLQSTGGPSFTGNFFSGHSAIGIVRFDPSCSGVVFDKDNILPSDCWIEDYSR